MKLEEKEKKLKRLNKRIASHPAFDKSTRGYMKVIHFFYPNLDRNQIRNLMNKDNRFFNKELYNLVMEIFRKDD